MGKLPISVQPLQTLRATEHLTCVRFAYIRYLAAMASPTDVGGRMPGSLLSPTKPASLKHSTGKILQLGSKMGAYVLLSDTLPKPCLGMVSFEVRIQVCTWAFSTLDRGTDFLLPMAVQAKGMNDILTCFHYEEKLMVGHEGRDDTAPAYEVRKSTFNVAALRKEMGVARFSSCTD